MIRPREMQSSIAISSATRTGLSRWGSGVPRMHDASPACVRRASAAAETGTAASRQVMRLVVLVEHDLEAQLVGVLVLVEVAVVQVGHLGSQ